MRYWLANTPNRFVGRCKWQPVVCYTVHIDASMRIGRCQEFMGRNVFVWRELIWPSRSSEIRFISNWDCTTKTHSYTYICVYMYFMWVYEHACGYRAHSYFGCLFNTNKNRNNSTPPSLHSHNDYAYSNIDLNMYKCVFIYIFVSVHFRLGFFKRNSIWSHLGMY